MSQKKFLLFIFFVIVFSSVFLSIPKNVFAKTKEECETTYKIDFEKCNSAPVIQGVDAVAKCKTKVESEKKDCIEKADGNSSSSNTNTNSTDKNGITNKDTSKFSSTMEPIVLPTYGPDSWSGLGKNIMDFMGWIAGIIFIGVLLIGAIIYITAGSNEQGAETGKKAIFAAIIGIVVTALAWAIVTFVAGIIK